MRRRILAVANQKGGVGKTTTAINLAAALVENGKSVLLIDLDPQGNASTGLGIDVADRDSTSYDLLVEGAAVGDVTRNSQIERLDIVAATGDLASVDVALVDDPDRAKRLMRALSSGLEGYDHVVIDCPPSLNLLTVNAMAAADAVLVPLQCEFFALEGLSQLLKTVKEIRRVLNPELEIDGVVLTMFDRRNNLSHMVAKDVRSNLGDVVYNTVIPRNVRLSEAASYAMPATVYDSNSAGSLAYRALAREMLARADADRAA
ncbi:ParA family protein [Rhodovulum sp. DZ06]|uniref:ParA family protein n=1 Tax=Rhodovulum sp. DZ06 TaxID=3425126 RepID=UPI003D339654